MSSLQRRLDLLSFIPPFPKKIESRRLLNLLEMNGHVDIGIRSIQRDLEAIERLSIFGLTVDKRSKPYGWSIDANWQKLNISLMDANTALAFSTLEQLADALLPDSTQKRLNAYFEKAKKLLEDDESSHISHWKNSVAMISHSVPFSLPKAKKEVLSTIKEALFKQKQLSAQLKRYLINKQEPVWKSYNHINPLGLIYQDGSPILLCSFGTMHTKIYRFPIAFIQNAQLENQASSVPEHFNFEIAKSSIEQPRGKEIALILHIRRDTPFIIKGGQLSENQTIIELADENYFELKATVNETPQLKAFLRGLGASVEVISPSTLREYFIEQIKILSEKYQ